MYALLHLTDKTTSAIDDAALLDDVIVSVSISYSCGNNDMFIEKIFRYCVLFTALQDRRLRLLVGSYEASTANLYLYFIKQC